MKPIYCDLDNVLVDFVTPSLIAHGREDLVNTPNWPPVFWYPALPEFAMTADDFWKPIIAAGPDWWTNLPKLPWADELMALLDSINPKWEIATACSSAESAFGKWRWRDINAKGHKIHVTENKIRLAERGALLIDDSDDNVDQWRAAGGDAILLPRSWNKLASVPDPLGWVRNQLVSLGYAG